ncbi:uncharacterized protein LACBIDRAFT_327445 [Laccaria bicolor S238N-H82]|uniref:Predicted protein n=1 Tax=Laccaria bicolor (strain S238N-H82 / ATCC MYA-4686) TaxID=486041 RepID=B0DB37_LACBS|nr:uncharacterized protein LACBIDRAFT_327445 [Laccaria bicolor S238N-H82]EDR08318.1 predicted protein [Laccaria bicolor S238N-H82]|eukprot:XP_001881388.1 predicted protein [Laccaria bicolor S238N-H82]
MSQARAAAAAGPSRLSTILAHLNASPKLTLSNLKSLRLTMAFRNDHFGARHFVKEHLPRIRYANPSLDIQVERVKKTQNEVWKPELELVFDNGRRQTINMHEKWSTAIVKEVMEAAGGDAWQTYKVEAEAAGREVVPGEAGEKSVLVSSGKTKGELLPGLDEFRKALRVKTSATATPSKANPSIPPEAISQVEVTASL